MTGEHESEALLIHAGWVRRLALALVRDPAEADDLVQDTWLAAVRHAPERAPRSWLERVLRNAWRQRWRGEHRAALESGKRLVMERDVLKSSTTFCRGRWLCNTSLQDFTSVDGREARGGQ